MAATTERNCCAVCFQERHTVPCEGCSKNYCFKHFHDHHQELSEQLDLIEADRDLSRQTLTEQASQSAQKHPSIEKINKWERESINQIQNIAKEARQILSKEITKHTIDMEGQFNQLDDQIRQSREDNDFIEKDLDKWGKELERLKEELTKLQNITLSKDFTSLLNKINIALKEFYKMVVALSTTATTNNEDQDEVKDNSYPITTFEQLNLIPDLLKGVYSMGFVSPSKIQCAALPHLLGNPPRNMIAQSQSGTGKTAAFALAIISRIDPSIQCPQALILAPTFELAVQIGLSIEKMSKFLPYIKVAYAVRDPSISNRANRVRNQVIPETIVVGTSGTLEEWCKKMQIIRLDQIRMCCIDEADVMIATVNFQSCVDLVQALNPANCQVMLFSATYSDEVMDFARQIIQNPVVLRLKREKQALLNIDQFFTNCYNDEHKYQAVQAIYAALAVGQAVIFCRTKRTAHDLHIQMANEGHSVRELTSDLDIEQRATVIKHFREGLFRVLISENVTVYGLDIDDVSLVINYDMPVTTKMKSDYETYLRRIGCCGRFGRKGYAFNLIGSEQDFQIMKRIETYFSHPIKEITIEEISGLGADEVN